MGTHGNGALLKAAFKQVEPDQVYYGSLFCGSYRYHGIGNRVIEFPRVNSENRRMFAEKMTGEELAAAIGNEIAAEEESLKRIETSFRNALESVIAEARQRREIESQRRLKTADKEWPIPVGATHYTYEYTGDKPMFFRTVENGIGPETGERFHCWATWDEGRWQKDLGICSRKFKEIDGQNPEIEPEEEAGSVCCR